MNDSLNRAALERWIVTNSRWKMNDPSRLSPDTSLILRPRSSKKWYAESFTEPKVSMAIGRKVYAEGIITIIIITPGRYLQCYHYHKVDCESLQGSFAKVYIL